MGWSSSIARLWIIPSNIICVVFVLGLIVKNDNPVYHNNLNLIWVRFYFGERRPVPLQRFLYQSLLRLVRSGIIKIKNRVRQHLEIKWLTYSIFFTYLISCFCNCLQFIGFTTLGRLLFW